MHITRPAQPAPAEGEGEGEGEGEAAKAAAEAEAQPAPEGGDAAKPAEAKAEGAKPAQGQAQGQGQGQGKAPAQPQARTELADASTLAQLESVDFGCCVATLRWVGGGGGGLRGRAKVYAGARERRSAAGACGRCSLFTAGRGGRESAAPRDDATLSNQGPLPVRPHFPPPPPRRRRDEDASALGFAVGSETEGALAAAAPLAISCWRGRGNLNVLVSKQVCCTCVYSMQGKLAPFVPWGRREPEGLSGRWVHGGRLA